MPNALNPHGYLPYIQDGPDVTLSSTSVAEGTFTKVASTKDAVAVGDSFPTPYANLKVQRVRSIRGPGYYTLICEGSGRIGGADAITYGPDTTLRATGLDEGIYEIACASRDGVAVGSAFPDSLAGIRVKEVKAKKLAGYYLLTCTGDGLAAGIGSTKIIGARWSYDPKNYDVLTITRIVGLSAADPTWGSVASTESDISAGSTMYLLSVQDTLKLDGYWKVREETYQGIKSDKVIDREVSVNESLQSPSEPITIDATGGWSDAFKAKVSLPRIVVRDTIITTDVPDTSIIPGRSTPPDAPPVQSFTLTGGLVRNWPNTWKLASIQDNLLYYGISGVAVRKVTLTYEYVWPAEFA
jgi:hypothetical protein